MYKYSIIIPIYNAEKYLDKCISSLMNQTYKNIEIILIDDGSKDSSYTKCINYAQRDKRIKIKHIDNSGVSHARNIGIELCSGDYILFVDSDDYINNTTIEKCNQLIEEYDIDILRFNYYKKTGVFLRKNKYHIDCNCLILKEQYKEKIYPFLFNTDDISNSCNTIFKRKNIGDLRFDENLQFSEDRKFLIDNINKSNNIYFYEKNLYYYVDNINSAINNIDKKKLLKKFENVTNCDIYFFNKYYQNIQEFMKRVKQSRDEFIISLNIISNYREYVEQIEKITSDLRIIEISKKYKSLTNQELFEECLEKKYFEDIKKIYKKNNVKRIIKKILSN